MNTPHDEWSEELLQKGKSRGRLEGFRTGYMQGFKAGFSQGRKEVARNMLLEGKTSSYISSVTGMAQNDVQNLSKSAAHSAALC